MMTVTVAPRVCIQCLASYNANRLIFEWCDATDVDEMNECRERVAKRAVEAAKEAGDYPIYFGEPEEFHFADNEGFGGWIGEYEDWEFVAELGKAIEEHGDGFVAMLEMSGRDDLPSDVSEMIDHFTDRYQSEYDSFRDFCYDRVDELGWAGLEASHPALESLRPYFDWDMIENELGQEFTEHNGHVFRSY